MAPRSSGKSVLSFGMVNIPIKMYSAQTGGSKIDFNLVSKSGQRLKQLYQDPDGNLMPQAECHRGYEISKDTYVVFTQEEIKSVAEAASPNIALEEFVPASSIHQGMVEKVYYLAPDTGGGKAFSLLAKTLALTNQVGIARWSVRGKQNLMALVPFREGLAFYQLLYADEMTPYEELKVTSQQCSDAELELAKRLVDSISKPKFDISVYKNEVNARLEQMIEDRVSGKEIQTPKVEAPKASSNDLLAALAASLGVAKK